MTGKLLASSTQVGVGEREGRTLRGNDAARTSSSQHLCPGWACGDTGQPVPLAEYGAACAHQQAVRGTLV